MRYIPDDYCIAQGWYVFEQPCVFHGLNVHNKRGMVAVLAPLPTSTIRILAVGGAEVGIGAEYHVIKKIGASVCTDIPIFHKAADELTVYAAPWIVHNLFYF